MGEENSRAVTGVSYLPDCEAKDGPLSVITSRLPNFPPKKRSRSWLKPIRGFVYSRPSAHQLFYAWTGEASAMAASAVSIWKENVSCR